MTANRYDIALALLRSRLRDLTASKDRAKRDLTAAANVTAQANAVLRGADVEISEILTAIHALEGGSPSDYVWHYTHRTETVMRGALEVTYCTGCGAGDPDIEEQHRKTDPCVGAEMACIYDDFGPVQPR